MQENKTSTESKPRQKTKRGSTAVNEARIRTLRYRLEQLGPLYLDYQTYRTLRDEGFSRGELHRCVELMVARGEVVVESRNYDIRVRLAKGADQAV